MLFPGTPLSQGNWYSVLCPWILWSRFRASFKCKHDFGMRGKNHHNVLFYNVQYTETVPCGNTVPNRHCFLLCDTKRTCHNEKTNIIQLICILFSYHPENPMRRDYITHNLMIKSCHTTPKWNRRLCFSPNFLSAHFLFWKSTCWNHATRKSNHCPITVVMLRWQTIWFFSMALWYEWREPRCSFNRCAQTSLPALNSLHSPLREHWEPASYKS